MSRRGRSRLKWLAVLIAVSSAGGGWALFGPSGMVQGQSQARTAADSVFTTSHRSTGEAIRHFFGMRNDPVQPIQFPHERHIAQEIACVVCHSGVEWSAVAGLPSVNTCMGCHVGIAEDKEPIIKITTEYYEKGRDLSWQRVYGWNDEAHVLFNHAPHIRSGVDCATCHGDLSKMTVAERAVDHTMGFCVDCHVEKKASIDCLTCHY
ncbi:MAG TPA: cytochrome c3 family protein [Terriglobia bacterium]|nr:cytochrome c3 family protein [Terriglobia bacterium]